MKSKKKMLKIKEELKKKKGKEKTDEVTTDTIIACVIRMLTIGPR